MKKQFLNKAKAVFLLTFFLYFISACDNGEDVDPIKISPDAESISDYVRGMSYNANELFNVQSISGSVSRQNVGGPVSNTTS